MKIAWKSIYGPLGRWEDESGAQVQMQGNFRGTYRGRLLLCIMTETRTAAGHGDPPMTVRVPSFVDAGTLEPVAVACGEFVEAIADCTHEWTHVKDSADGMMSLYRCASCGEECLV